MRSTRRSSISRTRRSARRRRARLPVSSARRGRFNLVRSSSFDARPYENRVELGLRPIQLLVQKLKRTFAINGVATVEVFDRSLVSKSELSVEPSDLRVFVRDPMIAGDAIVMASLRHEWPRDHE